MLYDFQVGIKKLLEENDKIKFDIYDYVLENAKSPYIVIGAERANVYRTKTSLDLDITTTINVWAHSRSMLQVKRIIDEIFKTLSVDFEQGNYVFYFIDTQGIDVNRETIDLVLGTIEIRYRGRLKE